MGKKILWASGIILLLIIAAGGYVYFSFFKSSPLAMLVIENGDVQYSKDGVEWKAASNGMTLKQGFSVKALENTLAKIIFSNSVLRLDSGTEVKIDNLNKNQVSVMQSAGRTWTRLLKISGISDYEVNTPNAIASVRGTGFSVAYDGKGTEVKVVEGTVNVKTDSSEGNVKENNQAKASEDGTITTENLTEDDWTTKNVALDREDKDALKARILSQYGSIINLVKSQYADMTDEKLNELFEQWYVGEVSLKKAIEDGSVSSTIASLIPEEFKRS